MLLRLGRKVIGLSEGMFRVSNDFCDGFNGFCHRPFPLFAELIAGLVPVARGKESLFGLRPLFAPTATKLITDRRFSLPYVQNYLTSTSEQKATKNATGFFVPQCVRIPGLNLP